MMINSVMRLYFCSIIFILTFIASISSVQADLGELNKIALVIGNSNYVKAPLANPKNDAEAIGASLKKIGFDVSILNRWFER